MNARDAVTNIIFGYAGCSDDRAGVIADAVLSALTAAGYALVPTSNNDNLRRAVWRAQFEHMNNLNAHGASAEALDHLAEEKVNDAAQREMDAAAYLALIAAAEGCGR